MEYGKKDKAKNTFNGTDDIYIKKTCLLGAIETLTGQDGHRFP